jgi:hypothetical protein
MTQVTDPTSTSPQTSSDSDLAAEVQRVLEASSEPLTLSKIRSSLPTRLRSISLEALAEVLRRQVAANVLIQYPKYRSQQDRFWDRPMPVHIAALLRQALEEIPLAWSELRRKLPDYAKAQAESVLEEQVARALLYRHPPASSRGGQRYGARPPETREYLRTELTAVFARLEKLGFTPAQLREGAMELLQEEEWATPPASSDVPGKAEPPATERRQEHAGHPGFEGPHTSTAPTAERTKPSVAQGGSSS